MLNLINELGPDRNKKETSSHLRSVRNSYVTIDIWHHAVCNCMLPQTYTQMHVQIKAFSSESTRFNPYTLAAIVAYTFYTGQSRD